MLNLFEIQFSAIAVKRLDERLSIPYIKKYVCVLKLIEKCNSFENFTALLGIELANTKSSFLFPDDEVQCLIDAFNIIESINRRFKC